MKVELKVEISQQYESEIHKIAFELLLYGGGDGARTHDLLSARWNVVGIKTVLLELC